MSPRSSQNSTLLLVACCVALSGAASLGLEVVWSRLLRLVFGSTTLAVTTILVAYMLGLGAGGLYGGRIASRLRNGVRAYGLIEIGVGVYALAVPTLLGFYPDLNRAVLASLGFWPAAFVRFALVLAVLLLPTFLMGATLPVLVASLVRSSGQIASRVGLLYGVNTLGAVLGVLGATFVGFAWLGVRGTNTLAALLDIGVGAIAVVFLAPRVAASDEPDEEPAQEVESTAGPQRRWSLALLSYGAVGFTALAYEIAWTRALSMMLGSSTYAFATMLAGFLAGIALGSLVARMWLDRLRNPMRYFCIGLLALGGLSLGVTVGFRYFPDLFLHALVAGEVDGGRLAWMGLVTAFLVMLGPTLVLGALFPLLVRVIAGDSQSSSGAVGDVYFINTVGSAAGAFSAGFLLIPTLGLRYTIALAVALNFATAALLCFAHAGAWRGRGGVLFGVLGAAAAVVVMVFPPAWNAERLASGVYYRAKSQLDFGLPPIPMEGVPGGELLYYREGINCTVSIHHESGGIEEGGVNMRINGKTDASISDMSTQVLSGHIPLLFGPEAKSVLVIGYASGVTTGAASLYDLDTLDVCEIEGAVIEASHWFDDYNHKPLDKPGVELIVDDGRTYLSYTDKQYDVIISEPSNPWISGCANLFTAEFFEEAKRALTPDGRLLQWVQLYGMDAEGLRSILSALHQSFKYAYGFLYHDEHTDLMLVATNRELEVEDLPRWEGLPAPVRRDLTRVRVFSTADLWSLMAVPPQGLAALGQQAAVVNSDDSMYVELNAPWRIYETKDDEDSHPALTIVRSVADGILPVLSEVGRDQGGVGAPLLGELAVSYLDRRRDVPVADAIHAELARRGDIAYRALYESERLKVEGQPAREMLPVQAKSHNDRVTELLNHAVRPGSREFAPYAHRGWWLKVIGDSVQVNLRARQREAASKSNEAEVRAFVAELKQLQESARAYHEAAVQDFDAALGLRPDQLEVRHRRASVLPELGRVEEAMREFAILVDSTLIETEPSLLVQAALLASHGGDLESAIRWMRRYAKLVPYSPYWRTLAQWYGQTGRTEEQAVAERNYTRAKLNEVRKYHRMARYHARFSEAEQSVLAYELVLQMDPNNLEAQEELAVQKERERRESEAEGQGQVDEP